MKVYYHECASLYWGFHDLYLRLMLHLKENNNITLIHEKGYDFINHPLPDFPDYKVAVPKCYVEEFQYPLQDCEFVIYDEKNDILKAVTFSETRSSTIETFVKRQNPNDILLCAHIHSALYAEYEAYVLHGQKWPHAFQIKVTPFYPFDPKVNLEYFYRQRKLKPQNQLRDKMIILTTPGTGRNDVSRLVELGVLDYNHGLNYFDYLSAISQYKIGLSIASVTEICHRDFEYMALGVPCLRLEYMVSPGPGNTFPPNSPMLIPNYHYIAVDNSEFPKNMWKNRDGGEQYVQAYVKRFMEVKDDKEFLDFIAKNGKEYYMKYCDESVKLRWILEMLELETDQEKRND